MGAEPIEPLQEAFAELVSKMALDLAKSTVTPAVADLQENWRTEVEQFRRDTAEWISRVNASRLHIDQVIERQHELAQEVYSTHANLLQEMAAFQKERRDALNWQEQVNTQLGRLSELQRELSVESTRLTGVVRDIISELARYQSAAEKRDEQLEAKISDLFAAAVAEQKAAAQAGAASTAAALASLSQSHEETRTTLGRDLTAMRRELQEVAGRLGRDIADGRNELMQKSKQQYEELREHTSAGHGRLFGTLVFGQVLIIAALGFLISRIL